MSILRSAMAKHDTGSGLRAVEALLQPPGEHVRRTPLWRKVVLATISIIAALWGTQVIWPSAHTTVTGFFARLPSEYQVPGLGSLIVVVGLGLGAGGYLAVRGALGARSLDRHLRGMRRTRKLAVHTAGSGAQGFIRATRDLGMLGAPRNLLVFAHPPVSGSKRGEIAVAGATTATAPVQDAMGRLEPAVSARDEEAVRYHVAYEAFLGCAGGQEVRVEWALIHLGQGHTSESVAIRWSEHQTAGVVGANPARFVVVVRDVSEPLADIPAGPDGLPTQSPGGTEPPAPAMDADPAREDPVSEGTPPILGEAHQQGVVVSVTTRSRVGTGVVYAPEGLIVTSSQIVPDDGPVQVTFPAGSAAPTDVQAEVLGRDEQTGVVALRCREAREAPVLSLGEGGLPAPGDRLVIVERAPGAAASSAESGTVTEVVTTTRGTRMRIDAAISPAAVGGALLTEAGQLAGIVLDAAPGGDGLLAVGTGDLVNGLREIHRQEGLRS